jgi:hypothetical protein
VGIFVDERLKQQKITSGYWQKLEINFLELTTRRMIETLQ